MATAALRVELDSGLQLLAELVQSPGAGLQALGQFLDLGLQHGLANPGGTLGPPGDEETAGAKEDDEVDRVVQRDGRVPPALQQLAVPAALPAKEEVEAAQDLAHLVLAGGRDLLHPPQLPGVAEDQGEVGRDGDGPSGGGHPQPHGRRQQRDPQGDGAERESHDGCDRARRAQQAARHVGRQGTPAEALEAPGHLAQAQQLPVQHAAAVQQQAVEAAQRIRALQLPGLRPLHALRGHDTRLARSQAQQMLPPKGKRVIFQWVMCQVLKDPFYNLGQVLQFSGP